MDLHPIIVHFPVALLTLYGIFELFSVRRIARKPYWFYVKAVLVIFGALGALAAWLTGESASHYVEGVALVDMHASFAGATVILSSVIALIYLLVWFGKEKVQEYAWKFLSNRGAMIPLALALVVLVIITGALGGAIVYGTQFDPFMAPIFHLLGV
ncbi:MAG: DUF2231 domain-containing protein [Patescibacteria group bacterium]